LLQQVQALEYAFDVEALGFGRLDHRLVVHRDVVQHIGVALIGGIVHPVDAVLDDVGDLIAVGRVVGDHRGAGGGQEVRMCVTMLQAFADHPREPTAEASDSADAHGDKGDSDRAYQTEHWLQAHHLNRLTTYGRA